MATFATAIDETGAFKLGNEFFYLLWHESMNSPVAIKSHFADEYRGGICHLLLGLGMQHEGLGEIGGTDCRFWRAKGTPAFVYGCLPDRMGAPDERVPVAEFLDIVHVHTLSAYDYLTRRGVLG